ncbi:unnamed protein product [Cyprideis torosa]|uniref:Uncharacterized protein n=1 Tax=Cyprideis torosa TaxID=163714 RepID=A0A7R8WHG4_9CRUS|nr:unnamed protein product [Cyprideis torosa]CAG0892892.1 unnamed protein product [Cyprideis torosa]
MFYYVVQFFIGIVKWVQWLVLACCPPFVRWLVNRTYKKSGIYINGKHPWDLQVHNPKFYLRAATEFTLGVGEAYMDGWWDCEDLVEAYYRLFKAGPYIPPLTRIFCKIGYCVNRQSRKFSLEVAKKHYDLGNELFQSFLDINMNYSCAYWRNAKDLEQAQLHKMDLIARKLKLKPGMRVLDIGCGWGTMAKYLAENYGVTVVGYNISKEQVEYARRINHGLPVEIRMEDYRNANEKFDRVYSIGFFEHVGTKNHRTYFEVANRCLVDNGLHLVQSITICHKNLVNNDEWVSKYIFPHGQLPYDYEYFQSTRGLFIIEDYHNFGHDYYRTLMAWYERFVEAWPKLKDTYGDRFFRMWKYYLLTCAASFKSRRVNLIQLVMSKDGLLGGYDSER